MTRPPAARAGRAIAVIVQAQARGQAHRQAARPAARLGRSGAVPAASGQVSRARRELERRRPKAG